MSGWYVAAALYVLGWFFATSAVIDYYDVTKGDDRMPVRWAFFFMVFWPIVTVAWLLSRAWKEMRA